MAHGGDGHVAHGGVLDVEVEAHADRVLDERGVVLAAAAAVDHKARRGELRGVDRAPRGARLAARHVLLGLDVETLEGVEPPLEAVGLVDRVVARILALLQQQAVDEAAAGGGRVHRYGRGRGARLVALAQREGEELVAQNPLGLGVEGDVEEGVGRLLDIFVARHLVDGEPLVGERVGAVALDREEDIHRVEEGLVAEVALLDLVVGGELREETRRAQAHGVVDHRPHIAVGELRADDRVGLEEAALDIFAGAQPGGLRRAVEDRVAGFHLLVLGDEVPAERVVDVGAARPCQGGGQGDGEGAHRGSELIGSLHRIGCSCRKSPHRPATGTRAASRRSAAPSPAPRGRCRAKPPPRRRHIVERSGADFRMTARREPTDFSSPRPRWRPWPRSRGRACRGRRRRRARRRSSRRGRWGRRRKCASGRWAPRSRTTRGSGPPRGSSAAS